MRLTELRDDRHAVLRQAALSGGDVIEDLLNEDDADVNAFGDVGKELVDDVVYGIQSQAGCDALDGGGSVALDAGNVEVREFGDDGIRAENAIVGNRLA